MSDYLIRELDALPNVDVRPRVQVVDGTGTEFLESFTLRDLDTGAETVESGVLFVLIGSEPRTDWLAGHPGLRPLGVPADRARPWRTTGRRRPGRWSGRRRCSRPACPGVFAAGDVRAGSVKRVASAVGEGALAVTLVHAHLAATTRRAPPDLKPGRVRSGSPDGVEPVRRARPG